MSDESREQYLRIALVVFGLIFLVGVLPLMMVWPSGWRWIPHQSEYEQMILGVYATLGIFLLLATRTPRLHRSLILFAAWSSLVHGGIMAVQALRGARWVTCLGMFQRWLSPASSSWCWLHVRFELSRGDRTAA